VVNISIKKCEAPRPVASFNSKTRQGSRRNQILSGDSISEMTLTAAVPGRGEIRAKVYKHLSPVTLSNIRRSIPFSGRVNFFDHSFAYILTPVLAGEEKSKKDLKKGSIAFMPSGGTLCFFLEDTRSYKPMNLLGQVESGMEVLEQLRRGDSIQIQTIS
jgi:hypothetical protein